MPCTLKGTPAVTSLRKALLTGRLQLRYNATVTRLVTDSGGRRVTAVEYLDRTRNVVTGRTELELRYIHDHRWCDTATIEALSRLCTYAGAALAAAHDRGRVEEVAALRERRRLARALHDDLGQRLFGIGMTARNARESATSGRADLLTQLLALEQEIAGVSASFRRTLTGLDTPTAPAGALAVKVREDLAGFDARTGIPAHLIVIGDPERIDGGRTDALIRAVQEGLRNIERHAQASEVVVTIGFSPGTVEVIMQDDGIGPGAGTGDGGFGLGQVRQELERLGGSLLLARADDSGAILKVRVPLV